MMNDDRRNRNEDQEEGAIFFCFVLFSVHFSHFFFRTVVRRGKSLGHLNSYFVKEKYPLVERKRGIHIRKKKNRKEGKGKRL